MSHAPRLVPPASEECRLLPNASVDPSPTDYQQLQELLQQALRREADAMRKINHLHQQLIVAEMKSESGSPRTDTPETCQWEQLDQMHELIQTPLGSPGTPPPTLVVSGSPKIGLKSRSQPNTPLPTTMSETSKKSGSSQFANFSKSHDALVEDKEKNGWNSASQEHWDGTGEAHTKVSSTKSGGGAEGHLMPTLQLLSDVRKEREKPPTNNSFERKHSTGLSKDPGPSSTAMPASPGHTVAGPTSQASLTHRSTSVEALGLVSSGSGGNTRDFNQSLEQTQAKNKSRTIGRASSIKNDRTRTSGHRSRSNSAFQVPSWLKRKRASRATGQERAQRPTDSIEELFEVFKKTAIIQIDPLSKYIDHHWSEVCAESICPPEVKKYREAVWDMFQSEAKYLTMFLQPLELVYKNFLDELHFHQILKVADVDKIFANVSELCELSSDVANNLFMLFDGRRGNNIAPVDELIKAFSMFGHKFNPVYQRFCINYEKQQGFVRVLHQVPDFQTYQSACRGHRVVGKNDLPSLLIAPMQHQCRYQLKLDQVLKYTQIPAEKELLSSTIKAFVVSLKELEANINEHKRSAELLELQETLYWPSVVQLNPEAYVSDTLKEQLGRQPCCELLASKDRQLVEKGTVCLLDGKGRATSELKAYLFTDLLLLTEEHRPNKKEAHNQLAQYKVFGHPMFLAHMEVFEVDTPRNSFTLVERTALQQRIKLYSLQANSRDERTKWISHIGRTQELHRRRHQHNVLESDV